MHHVYFLEVVQFTSYDKNSIRAITNQNGETVETYSYNSFGIMTIKDQYGQVILKSNYGNEYTYTGRRYDSETELYYYRNRMYSAQLGRFLSNDPLGYVDGFNLYAYAQNNPLKYNDPMGTTSRLKTGDTLDGELDETRNNGGSASEKRLDVDALNNPWDYHNSFYDGNFENSSIYSCTTWFLL